MKKELIFGLAMLPTVVMAAGTATTGTTTVTANNCTLLQDDLTIQLSTNVVGGYSCDTAGTPAAFWVAACHTGGRTASRTSTVFVPSGCGIGTAPACSTAASTVSGAVVPKASTQGGSMNMQFPGSNCANTGATASATLP